MLTVVSALGASLGWGSSDFLGGLKSRTVPLLSVLLISQVTALALLTALVVVRGAGPPDAASLGYAAAAGLGETVALAALYRGLAVGTMSIVAPIAASAPVVPLVAGLVTGEVPGPLQFAGLALVLAGLVITSRRPGDADGSAPRVLPSIIYGLLAALGFGTFFFAMGSASEDDIGWAVFAARLTSVSALAITAVARRHHFALSGSDVPVIGLIGILMVAADSLYAIAATHGLVSVAAVLGSLHAVVTMALARIFLHERLERPQKIGVGTCLLGVLALSAA